MYVLLFLIKKMISNSIKASLGGVSIQIISIKNVALFPIGFGPVENIDLIEGKEWIDIAVKYASVKEKNVNGAGGPIFDVNIEAELNQDSEEYNDFLEINSGAKFLVICKNKKGERKVYGTKEYPIKMEWNHNSGKKVENPNKNVLKFRGKTPRKSRFYMG